MATFILAAPVSSNTVTISGGSDVLVVGSTYTIDFPTNPNTGLIWQEDGIRATRKGDSTVRFVDFVKNVLPFVEFTVVRAIPAPNTSSKQGKGTHYQVSWKNPKWNSRVPAELTHYTGSFTPLSVYSDRDEINTTPSFVFSVRTANVIIGSEFRENDPCVNNNPQFDTTAGYTGTCVLARAVNDGCTDPHAFNYNPLYRPGKGDEMPSGGWDSYADAGKCHYDDLGSKEKALKLNSTGFYNYSIKALQEEPPSLSRWLWEEDKELPENIQGGGVVKEYALGSSSMDLVTTSGPIGQSTAWDYATIDFSLINSSGLVNVWAEVNPSVASDISSIQWDVDYVFANGTLQSPDNTGPGIPGLNAWMPSGITMLWGGIAGNYNVVGDWYNGLSYDAAYNNMSDYNYTYTEGWHHIVLRIVLNSGQIIQTWSRFNLVVTISGCTDSTSFNYDPDATTDDGSCEDPSIGCMDNGSSFTTSTGYNSIGTLEGATFYTAAIPGTPNDNYNANFNIHVPSMCFYTGCMDSSATNYNDAYNVPCNGCCTYHANTDVYGCTDATTNSNLNPANLYGTGPFLPNGGTIVDPAIVNINYNPNATIDTGCISKTAGCLNPLALNFNAGGKVNWHLPDSCRYEFCDLAAATNTGYSPELDGQIVNGALYANNFQINSYAMTYTGPEGLTNNNPDLINSGLGQFWNIIPATPAFDTLVLSDPAYIQNNTLCTYSVTYDELCATERQDEGLDGNMGADTIGYGTLVETAGGNAGELQNVSTQACVSQLNDVVQTTVGGITVDVLNENSVTVQIIDAESPLLYLTNPEDNGVAVWDYTGNNTGDTADNITLNNITDPSNASAALQAAGYTGNLTAKAYYYFRVVAPAEDFSVGVTLDTSTATANLGVPVQVLFGSAANNITKVSYQQGTYYYIPGATAEYFQAGATNTDIPIGYAPGTTATGIGKSSTLTNLHNCSTIDTAEGGIYADSEESMYIVYKVEVTNPCLYDAINFVIGADMDGYPELTILNDPVFTTVKVGCQESNATNYDPLATSNTLTEFNADGGTFANDWQGYISAGGCYIEGCVDEYYSGYDSTITDTTSTLVSFNTLIGGVFKQIIYSEDENGDITGVSTTVDLPIFPGMDLPDQGGYIYKLATADDGLQYAYIAAYEDYHKGSAASAYFFNFDWAFARRDLLFGEDGSTGVDIDGHSDWYVPSASDFQSMWDNLMTSPHTVGEFGFSVYDVGAAAGTTSAYWSSNYSLDSWDTILNGNPPADGLLDLNNLDAYAYSIRFTTINGYLSAVNNPVYNKFRIRPVRKVLLSDIANNSVDLPLVNDCEGGTEEVVGCTDPNATNYNPLATTTVDPIVLYNESEGSIIYPGSNGDCTYEFTYDTVEDIWPEITFDDTWSHENLSYTDNNTFDSSLVAIVNDWLGGGGSYPLGQIIPALLAPCLEYLNLPNTSVLYADGSYNFNYLKHNIYYADKVQLIGGTQTNDVQNFKVYCTNPEEAKVTYRIDSGANLAATPSTYLLSDSSAMLTNIAEESVTSVVASFTNAGYVGNMTATYTYQFRIDAGVTVRQNSSTGNPYTPAEITAGVFFTHSNANNDLVSPVTVSAPDGTVIATMNTQTIGAPLNIGSLPNVATASLSSDGELMTDYNFNLGGSGFTAIEAGDRPFIMTDIGSGDYVARRATGGTGDNGIKRSIAVEQNKTYIVRYSKSCSSSPAGSSTVVKVKTSGVGGDSNIGFDGSIADSNTVTSIFTYTGIATTLDINLVALGNWEGDILSFSVKEANVSHDDGYMYSETGSSITTDLAGTLTGCATGVVDDAYYIYFVTFPIGFTGTFDFSPYYEIIPPLSGCMDTTAQNYDAAAEVSAGNAYDCLYHLVGVDGSGDVDIDITTTNQGSGNEDTGTSYEDETGTVISGSGCSYEGTINVIVDPAIYSNAEINLILLQVQITGNVTSYVPILTATTLEPCLEGVGASEEDTVAITATFYYDPTPGESMFNYDGLSDGGNIPYISGQTDAGLNGFIPVEGTEYTSTFVIQYTEVYDSLVDNPDYPNYSGITTTSDTFTIQPVIYGCTDPNSVNWHHPNNVYSDYTTTANCDDGSCTFKIYGCTDPLSSNYSEDANVNETSASNAASPCYAIVNGCTDADAINTSFDVNYTPNVNGTWPAAPYNNVFGDDCLSANCINTPSDDATCVYCEDLDVTISSLTTTSTDDDYGYISVYSDTIAQVQFEVGPPLNSIGNGSDHIEDMNAVTPVTFTYSNGVTTSTGVQQMTYASLLQGESFNPQRITVPVFQPAGFIFNESAAAPSASPLTLTNVAFDIFYNDRVADGDSANTNSRCVWHVDESIDTNVFPGLAVGCNDSSQFNFEAAANYNAGTECDPIVTGCTNTNATNYNALANTDDASCLILGCTDNTADNFTDTTANVDDGSCKYYGCTYEWGVNYDSSATHDDGSCFTQGCKDLVAYNTHYCLLPGDPHNCFTNNNIDTSGVYTTYTADSVVANSTLCVYVGCMDTGLNYTTPEIDLGAAATAALANGEFTSSYTALDLSVPDTYVGTQLGVIQSATYVSSNPGQIADGTISYDSNASIPCVGCCQWSGCTDTEADNYDSGATQDDGSCITNGCIDTGVDSSLYPIGFTNANNVTGATGNAVLSLDLLSPTYKWLERSEGNSGWDSDNNITSTEGSLSVTAGGATPTNILQAFIGPADDVWSLLSPDAAFEFGNLEYSNQYVLNTTHTVTGGNGIDGVYFSLYQFNTDIASISGTTDLDSNVTEVIQVITSSVGSLDIPVIDFLKVDPNLPDTPLTATSFKLVLRGLGANQTVTITSIELKKILNTSTTVSITDLNSDNIDTYDTLGVSILTDSDFTAILADTDDDNSLHPTGEVPAGTVWKRSYDVLHGTGPFLSTHTGLWLAISGGQPGFGGATSM